MQVRTTSSCRLFCSGVPVSRSLHLACIFISASYRWLWKFLSMWPSSKTQTYGKTPQRLFSASMKRIPYLPIHLLKELPIMFISRSEVIRSEDHIPLAVLKLIAQIDALVLGAVVGLDVDARCESLKFSNPVFQRRWSGNERAFVSRVSSVLG